MYTHFHFENGDLEEAIISFMAIWCILCQFWVRFLRRVFLANSPSSWKILLSIFLFGPKGKSTLIDGVEELHKIIDTQPYLKTKQHSLVNFFEYS